MDQVKGPPVSLFPATAAPRPTDDWSSADACTSTSFPCASFLPGGAPRESTPSGSNTPSRCAWLCLRTSFTLCSSTAPSTAEPVRLCSCGEPSPAAAFRLAVSGLPEVLTGPSALHQPDQPGLSVRQLLLSSRRRVSACCAVLCSLGASTPLLGQPSRLSFLLQSKDSGSVSCRLLCHQAALAAGL